MRCVRSPIVVLVALVGALLAPAAAGAQDPTASTAPGGRTFAPLDAEPPDLIASEDQLDRALDCPTLAEGDRAVLLIHGTAADATTNWDWGWRPALEAEGLSVCTVDLVNSGLGDAQLSAERVVHAIRTIHAATDDPVGVLGYSQGGAAVRFALRFWGDLRPMVDDVVLLASAAVGTAAAEPLCANGCAPAIQQFRRDSDFLAAMNSRVLVFPGIDYTNVYTRFDDLLTPNEDGQASIIEGTENIAVQDLCPADTSDHLTVGTTDPVAYALALDAFTHDGPADPARIPPTVCDQPYLPGVDEVEAQAGKDALNRLAVRAYRDTSLVTREPELRCFVTSSCTSATTVTTAADSGGGGSLTFWRVGALLLLVGGIVGSVWGVVRHRRDQARRWGEHREPPDA